jgi:hypothetical protein
MMKLRHAAAEALLYAAALTFAVWFGGQVFNALMVVPVWSAKPPDSVVSWNAPNRAYDSHRTNFFALFSPLWVTLMLGASLLLGRGGGRARRRWVGAFALCSAAATLAVFGWMALTVGRTLRAFTEGTYGPEHFDTLRLWVTANWARLGLELCGLLCAFRALRAAPSHEPARAAAPDAKAEATRAAALGRA